MANVVFFAHDIFVSIPKTTGETLNSMLAKLSKISIKSRHFSSTLIRHLVKIKSHVRECKFS